MHPCLLARFLSCLPAFLIHSRLSPSVFRPCFIRGSNFPLALLICGLVAEAARAAEVVISSAAPATNGFVVHTVQSEFQAGLTKIYVRVPNKIAPGARLPVLYLLPVEAKDEQRWGDPLAEAAKLDLANKLNVICVYPTFSHLPWYCDHATDPGIRQETYFLKVVVPLF